MSLVNDMLRDLDRRQAPENAPPTHAAAYGALVQGDDGKLRRWLIVLVILLILVAGMAGYFAWQVRSQSLVSAGLGSSPPPSNQSTPGVSAPEATPGMKTETETVKSSRSANPSTAEDVPPELPGEQAAYVDPPPQPDKQDSAPSVKHAIMVAQDAPQPVPAVSPEVGSDHSVAGALDAAPVPVVDADSVVDHPRPDETLVKRPVRTPAQEDIESAEYGLSLYRQNRVRDAVMAMMSFVQTHPVNARTRYALAHVYFREGNPEEAEALIRPEDMAQIPMRELKARIVMARGDLDGAIRILTDQETPLSGNETYHALLAALYQQAGRYKEAVTKYTELLNTDAGQAVWWMGLAISLEQLGQYDSALRAYRKGVQGKGGAPELVQFGQDRIQWLAGRVRDR